MRVPGACVACAAREEQLNKTHRAAISPKARYVRSACCIPRLSKAGMPSRSDGWGGLFKGEQYRLIRSAARPSIRWLCDFEQTTPGASRPPLLTKEGNGDEPHLPISDGICLGPSHLLIAAKHRMVPPAEYLKNPQTRCAHLPE